MYYSKPDVAQATCLVLGTVCDYPILLGASLSPLVHSDAHCLYQEMILYMEVGPDTT